MWGVPRVNTPALLESGPPALGSSSAGPRDRTGVGASLRKKPGGRLLGRGPWKLQNCPSLGSGRFARCQNQLQGSSQWKPGALPRSPPLLTTLQLLRPGTEVTTSGRGAVPLRPSAPDMACGQVLLFAGLSALGLLALLQGGTGASVGTGQAGPQEAQEDTGQIFMQESDASNFLNKRSRRSPKSPDEAYAETRQKLRAEELRREDLEEQRSEQEHYAEEQRDEQEERSREAIEQWRQWHYDGLSPPYLYNRHHI
ncbi:unique cartilage matrix-associated protein isoform X2 [Sorex fumeus]|uniref:unique cartilage matrix-associated protein isoform X2 n=1 Tax=Sorex fumeus TaxID=62283 RepID=UPI0024ADE990|nr:unique cartilage matrix-associated protein isoform X2 [Sorex fumeus]